MEDKVENKPVRVLIVDDSRTEQIMLSEILSADPGISVIGTVDSGIAALNFIKRDCPDLITMDLKMPDFDGLQVTRAIMERQPIPIIIVTVDHALTTAENAFKLLEAGAVGVVEKPFSFHPQQQQALSSQLCRLVRSLAKVKLVHRWPRSASPSLLQSDPHLLLPIAKQAQSTASEPVEAKNSNSPKSTVTNLPYVAIEGSKAQLAHLKANRKAIACIAIGASTGGPPVLKHILDNLPAVLPVPIFIAQHMSPGFMEGFGHWLQKEMNHPLLIPAHGQKIEKGTVYLAPAGFHMLIDSSGSIVLKPRPDGDTSLKSVSSIFSSVAEHYGASALAILLTGMGSDGAQELRELRDCGAVTIAQDENTSVVFGMPGIAVKLDAAQLVLSPEQISEAINLLCQIS